MKKYLYFLFILFLLFFISCNKREFNNKPLSIEIHIGEEYLIEPITNGVKDPKFDIELISKCDKNYNEVISYDNYLVKGLSSGEVLIKIHLDGFDPWDINVKVLDIEIDKIEVDTKEINIRVGEKKSIDYKVLPINAIQDVVITSNNESVVSILDDYSIQGNSIGEATIIITSVFNQSITEEIKVIVSSPLASSISLSDKEIDLELGLSSPISYSILPNDALQELVIEYDFDSLEIKDGYIYSYKSGSFTINFKTIDGSNLIESLVVNVKKEDKPIFRVDENYKEEETIDWNSKFYPLKGVSAFDSEDGDISSNITISGGFDSLVFGTHIITYSVHDSDNNITTMTRTINVIWPYHTMVIGHAGSYYGVMNSLEAILAGVDKMHYPAIEIDVKQTKDGVFVLSHDPEFGGYNLEDYDYDFLKDIEVTVTRNKGIVPLIEEERTYTGRLCTLESYLKICKEYGVIAVIELKTSTGISNWTETHNPSGSRMPALMEVINKCDMSHNVIFLSNQYECLHWTRLNGYEYIPCQYLVNDLSNMDYYNICVEYNLDISTNVRDGIQISDEWLNLYKEAGIKISTYTFEEYASYSDVQKWIDRGVDFVTVDWHDILKLKFE